MRITTIQLLMIVLAAFTLNACLKDELTEGEIGDGHIAEQIKLYKSNCKRRQITIKIDSIVNHGISPIYRKELCNCDTVDLTVDTLGSNIIYLGMAEYDKPNPILDNQVLGITENWIGQIFIADSFLFDVVTVTVSLDFNKCE